MWPKEHIKFSTWPADKNNCPPLLSRHQHDLHLIVGTDDGHQRPPEQAEPVKPEPIPQRPYGLLQPTDCSWVRRHSFNTFGNFLNILFIFEFFIIFKLHQMPFHNSNNIFCCRLQVNFFGYERFKMNKSN